jgi:hypothetical protein
MGVVIFLFEDNKSTLQRSLASSMQFLYHESDQVKNWTELVPIYISPALKPKIEHYFARLLQQSSLYSTNNT